jgi:hypothetical protein
MGIHTSVSGLADGIVKICLQGDRQEDPENYRVDKTMRGGGKK